MNFKVGNPQDLDKLEAIHKKLAKLKRKEIRLKNKIARHMPECHGVMVGDTFQPVHPVYIGLGDNLEISQRHKPGHMEEVDRFPVYGRFTEEEPKPTIWDRLFGWIWW
ncbi:MAG: hypothetical protein KAS32_24785 [Candidatus Peribacteraceae bacterium]|nr:hypothetical protein [Candidatus Peribacteraceae bacterium]